MLIGRKFVNLQYNVDNFLRQAELSKIHFYDPACIPTFYIGITTVVVQIYSCLLNLHIPVVNIFWGIVN